MCDPKKQTVRELTTAEALHLDVRPSKKTADVFLAP
jgi:hypothetical protein